MEKFFDRQQAGKILAKYLKKYTDKSDVIVLALPRGGVPVAYEIAKTISAPLDVYIVRKLGVPGQEEFAMGAIAMDGTILLNQEIVQDLGISKTAIADVIKSEQEELNRRKTIYRANRPLPHLTNKTIILVDDGIATGATMRAAIQALQQQKPKYLIVAVPVAAMDTCEKIETMVDEFICPLRPLFFYGVGVWYVDFSQTTDAEVLELLAKANVESE